MSKKSEGKLHNGKRLRQSFRSNSPKYDRYARQRRHDTETDELIRFVRECQTETEPSVRRLKKLAPLPKIGQSRRISVDELPGSNFVSSSMSSFADSDADDGLGDSFASFAGADDDLDSELSSFSERLAPTADFSRGPAKQCGLMNSNIYYPKKKKVRGKSRKAQNLTNERYSLSMPKSHKLPPLVSEDLLNRPSAPAPSFTPDEFESSNEFLTEDQYSHVDYIEPV